jgi:hypothetical protein
MSEHVRDGNRRFKRVCRGARGRNVQRVAARPHSASARAPRVMVGKPRLRQQPPAACGAAARRVVTAHTWDMAGRFCATRTTRSRSTQRGHGDTEWTPDDQFDQDNHELTTAGRASYGSLLASGAPSRGTARARDSMKAIRQHCRARRSDTVSVASSGRLEDHTPRAPHGEPWQATKRLGPQNRNLKREETGRRQLANATLGPHRVTSIARKCPQGAGHVAGVARTAERK